MSEEGDNLDNDPVLQWVTFNLLDEVYGLNVIQVQEVLRITDITPVPGSPSFVLGIINLRGNVVTVIDTRLRFGLPIKETDDLARIIVVEIGNVAIGMLVDSVTEVVYLHQSEIDTAPHANNDDSSPFILGVVNSNDNLLILVDVNKLLGDDESSDVF